jgi:fructokinase
MNTLFGSLELGGTKTVCALGSGPDDIREALSFATTVPEETLGRAADFFREARGRHGGLDALGVCSFGPLCLDRSSPLYGNITTTPKSGWGNTDVLGFLGKRFPVPAGFETDVAGAALGEARWGAAAGLKNVLYITVGTGIGGGFLADRKPLHGLVHPEMGHIRIPHDRSRDPYPGSCPYHGDCLEGLASGTAIRERWGRPGQDLFDHHKVWDLESDYLAWGVGNFILTLSPEIVILGGGVMKARGLLPAVRRKTRDRLASYIKSPLLQDGLDSYIVSPGLGDGSGIAGGFVLAARALEEKKEKT